MTENEAFIFESIFHQVRMGFLSIEEIKENVIEEVEDNGFDSEISENWIYKIIDEEYEKLISESKHWKSPTDTEKLIEAFDQLCINNIIALHKAGYTTSDGDYEVLEVERILRAKKKPSDGYCFYHEQDLARAVSIENPNLYIAFQKVDNSDDQVTLEVGRRVVKILIEKGFQVEWSEDVNSKILIPNFKWQYLYDNNNRDLLNYNQTIALMTHKQKGSTTKKKKDTQSTKSKDIDNNNLWSKLKNVWS